MNFELIYPKAELVAKLLKRGYDLNDPSVLDGSHFATQDDAVDDFLQIAFDKIYELVRMYRGNHWTKAFFEDMQHDDLTGEALQYQTILKEAIVEQAVFIYVNGDKEALSDSKDERTEYSPIAIKKLWNYIIKG